MIINILLENFLLIKPQYIDIYQYKLVKKGATYPVGIESG